MNKRIRRYKQRRIDRNFIKDITFGITIIIILLLLSITRTSGNNKIEDETYTTIYESTTIEQTTKTKKENDNHDIVVSSANVLTVETTKPVIEKWNSEEKYLLAKIAMAEAEGESLETKVLVVLTILNRVESNQFPNTIRDVIFQRNKNGVYQFTCIGDGRWNRVEPNEECYKAVEIISKMEYDSSNGALYFEACKGESWHSRNLKLICTSDNTRFYK